MAEDQDQDAAARFSDPEPMTVTAAGVGASPEALAVLRRDGVPAWRTWVAEHGGTP